MKSGYISPHSRLACKVVAAGDTADIWMLGERKQVPVIMWNLRTAGQLAAII